MPIKKAAKKSLGQTKKRTLKNKAIRENYKSLIKKAKKEVAGKKKESAKTIAEIASLVDKAAKRGVIHKNKAARIKSKLMKELSKAFDKKVTLVKRDRIKQEAKPKKEKKPSSASASAKATADKKATKGKKEVKKPASTAKRGETAKK